MKTILNLMALGIFMATLISTGFAYSDDLFLPNYDNLDMDPEIKNEAFENGIIKADLYLSKDGCMQLICTVMELNRTVHSLCLKYPNANSLELRVFSIRKAFCKSGKPIQLTTHKMNKSDIDSVRKHKTFNHYRETQGLTETTKKEIKSTWLHGENFLDIF